MRKKQKHFTRLLYGILSLFLIGLAFGSCEAERDITNEKALEKLTIRRCSMKDNSLKSNSKLQKALNQLIDFDFNRNLSLDTNARILYNENTGLFYDDEKGIYIEKDGQESYNFPVIQTDDTENIKNITFTKNNNNEYDVYLVNYDYSKVDVQNFSNEELSQRQIIFHPLVKDGIIYPDILNTIVCTTTTTVVASWVEEHEGFIYYCQTISISTNCEWIGGGGFGPNQGGSVGMGSEVSPLNQENPILAAAVIIDGGDFSSRPPCDILKEQVDNNPIFDNKLDSLKQRVLATNPNPDTYESAILVKRTTAPSGNDNFTYTNFNDNVSITGSTIVNAGMSEWDIAYMHNHPINHVPIFSNIDIVDFFASYNFVRPSRKNEYTSYLVCFNGATYALRMENVNAMTELFTGLNLDTEQGRKDAEKKVSDIFKKHGFNPNQDYTQAMAEDLFIDVMDDALLGGGNGINIYRRDENGWGKLTCGSSGIVQKTDCN
jgi:hypothetical protein